MHDCQERWEEHNRAVGSADQSAQVELARIALAELPTASIALSDARFGSGAR